MGFGIGPANLQGGGGAGGWGGGGLTVEDVLGLERSDVSLSGNLHKTLNPNLTRTKPMPTRML